MKLIKCNCCGKIINAQDYEYGLGVHKKLGYGSIYDGKEIDLDLCCDCLDKLLTYMSEIYKYLPIQS